MDGLFKKTMSYLNSEGVVQDEFVGRVVEVASIKLKILRKIAEGEKFFLFVVIFGKAHDNLTLSDKAVVGGHKRKQSTQFLSLILLIVPRLVQRQLKLSFHRKREMNYN